MGFYVPNTEKQQREMLMDIGLDNFDELFHRSLRRSFFRKALISLVG